MAAQALPERLGRRGSEHTDVVSYVRDCSYGHAHSSDESDSGVGCMIDELPRHRDAAKSSHDTNDESAEEQPVAVKPVAKSKRKPKANAKRGARGKKENVSPTPNATAASPLLAPAPGRCNETSTLKRAPVAAPPRVYTVHYPDDRPPSPRRRGRRGSYSDDGSYESEDSDAGRQMKHHQVLATGVAPALVGEYDSALYMERRASRGSSRRYGDNFTPGNIPEKMARVRWMLHRSLNAVGLGDASYCHGSSLNKETPVAIRIEGVNEGQPISLPLDNATLKAVVAACQKAPFGRKEKTLLDDNVRKTWQLDPSKVVVAINDWDSILATAVTEASRALGVAPESVTHELYKCLVYEKGGHFAKHRDTEKSPGMFASLVVTLPCSYHGGVLRVSHKNNFTEFDYAHEGDKVHFMTFFADCEHELLPVTSGHRICLVYNLMRPIASAGTLEQSETTISPGNALKESILNVSEEQLLEITTAMEQWNALDQHPQPLLLYALDHQYSCDGFRETGLKGRDLEVAKFLNTARRRSGGTFDFEVALLDVHISQDGEIGEAYRERSCHYTMQFAGAALNSFDYARIFTRAKVNLLYVQPGSVLYNSEEANSNTGNEGAQRSRWYQRAVILVWPRIAREEYFDFPHPSGVLLGRARTLANIASTECDTARAATLRADAMRCYDAFLGSNSKKHRGRLSHHKAPPSFILPVTRVALLLGDIDKIHAAARALATDLFGQDAIGSEHLTAMEELGGATGVQELLIGAVAAHATAAKNARDSSRCAISSLQGGKEALLRWLAAAATHAGSERTTQLSIFMAAVGYASRDGVSVEEFAPLAALVASQAADPSFTSDAEQILASARGGAVLSIIHAVLSLPVDVDATGATECVAQAARTCLLAEAQREPFATRFTVDVLANLRLLVARYPTEEGLPTLVATTVAQAKFNREQFGDVLAFLAEFAPRDPAAPERVPRPMVRAYLRDRVWTQVAAELAERAKQSYYGDSSSEFAKALLGNLSACPGAWAACEDLLLAAPATALTMSMLIAGAADQALTDVPACIDVLERMRDAAFANVLPWCKSGRARGLLEAHLGLTEARAGVPVAEMAAADKQAALDTVEAALAMTIRADGTQRQALGDAVSDVRQRAGWTAIGAVATKLGLPLKQQQRRYW